MLNNIKIAFSDLDGTLTNDKKIITEETIHALKKLKEKNIKLVLASGRWDTFLLDYDKDINLFDYLVCNNGAEVYDIKNKKAIKEEILDKELVNNIKQYCESIGVDLFLNILLGRIGIDEEIKSNVYQIVLKCNKIEQVDKLIEYAKENNIKIPYISLAYYLKQENKNISINFNTMSTDKGTSIEYLLNYLNINKEDSICFGDNTNDIDMFNACGIKVAMQNGLKELKDMADYVTISNDEDGVAYFINTKIL